MFQESSVHLQLTIVDTPGFGDAIDNSNCWNPVRNHYFWITSFLFISTILTKVFVVGIISKLINYVHICITFYYQVLNYVEAQYETFMDAETRVNRVPIQDTRVHACLYFIAPSGHGLKPLDVEFMRKLQDKVNIIPVIGKADTLTPVMSNAFIVNSI